MFAPEVERLGRQQQLQLQVAVVVVVVVAGGTPDE